MKRLLGSIAALWVLAASGAGWAMGEGVMVHDPWIREAPPTASALAGYMEINNHSKMRQTLVGATSDDFAKVMLHQTVMQGGTAKMVHRHKIEIPKGMKLAFKPGGYHLMMMKPKRKLKVGDQVTVALEFSEGSKREVVFTVRKAMGMAGGHHKH